MGVFDASNKQYDSAGEPCILIAAGGTGGHVFPGLAVAEQLRERNASVIWLGTAAGIESRLVPENNIALHCINVRGVRGKSLLYWVKAPFQMLGAVSSVMRLIRQKRVDVVLGMGGYVSVAAGVAAFLLRKPLVLQEQNAIAGSANRLLAPFAKAIFTGFEGAFRGRKNVCWSGNPLRAVFEDVSDSFKNRSTAVIRILVLGGSQGAHSLNTVVPEAIGLLDKDSTLPAIEVQHQAGQADADAVTQAYQAANIPAEVSGFIDDMLAAYQAADLVIARSGALTVSEICAAGVAAVFVPYPYAIDDHQTANASVLVKNGAALLVPQSELNAQSLAKVLSGLMKEAGLLIKMADKARALAKYDAAQVVADTCRELAYG